MVFLNITIYVLVTDDLKNLVLKLENRVSQLEKGGSGSKPAAAAPAPAKVEEDEDAKAEKVISMIEIC